MKLGPPLLYGATAGGLALTARAMLGHPLPTVPAAALLLAYGGLVFTGLKVPSLGMWGDIQCHTTGGVAFTMDDPGDESLAALPDAHETPVLVFALASEIRAREGVFRALVARGHGLGLAGTSPGVSLAWMPWEASRDALLHARDDVAAIVGKEPRSVRPRERSFTPRLLRGADEAGLRVVGWSLWRGAARARPTMGDVVDLADLAALKDARARAAAQQLRVVSL